MTIKGPAPKACISCPYRQDVPSGIWAAEEYAKLPEYDGETFEQPTGIFQCHQNDTGDERARMCAGWVGCHDTPGLMALRLGLVAGHVAPETVEAALDYVSPVPLFASGAEAAAHGVKDLEDPSPEAVRLIEKITRVRTDIRDS